MPGHRTLEGPADARDLAHRWPPARRALPFISLVCRSDVDRLTVTTVDEPRYVDVAHPLLGAPPAPDNRRENALRLAEQMQAVAGFPGRVEGVPLAGLAGAEI